MQMQKDGMTKNEKSEIKSIIEYLLELRKKEIEKNKFLEMTHSLIIKRFSGGILPI